MAGTEPRKTFAGRLGSSVVRGTAVRTPGARRVNRTSDGSGESSTNIYGQLHYVEGWDINDDAHANFLTHHTPLLMSWNLELNGLRVHRDDWSIDGKVITITDPADLFLGVATQDPPWDLEIQYDYLQGSSVTSVSFVSSDADNVVNPTLTVTDVEPGDLIILAVVSQASFTVTSPAFDEYDADAAIGPGSIPAKVYTRVADGTESSIVISAAGGAFSRVASGVMVMRGGGIVDEQKTEGGTGSSASVPVLTGMAANEGAVVIGFSAYNTVSGTQTGPTTPYSTPVDVASSGGKHQLKMSYWINGAGDDGNPADTVTYSGDIYGWNVRTLRIG